MPGIASNIVLDVGQLWVAPIGTPEPTGNVVTAAMPLVGYRAIGYSTAGSKFIWTPTFSPIEVEEEFYPIRWAMSKIEAAVEFVVDEMTRANLALAMNAGANAVNDTSLFEPPTPGAEQRIMLVWDSPVIGERWLFRQCIQVGSIDIERRKAPNRSSMAMKFQLEKPSGIAPFRVWPSAVATGVNAGSPSQV